MPDIAVSALGGKEPRGSGRFYARPRQVSREIMPRWTCGRPNPPPIVRRSSEVDVVPKGKTMRTRPNAQGGTGKA
jgi:hypothetical protein